MKKVLGAVLLVVLLTGFLASCRSSEQTPASTQGVPNPVATYQSVTGVNDVVGFDMLELPQSLGFKAASYEAIDKTIAQMDYTKTEQQEQEQTEEEEAAQTQEPEGQRLTVRMAEGKDDITGIYGIEYDTEAFHGIDVNMGMYNDIHVAWWTDDAYTYAITGYEIDGASFDNVVHAAVATLLGLDEEAA